MQRLPIAQMGCSPVATAPQALGLREEGGSPQAIPNLSDQFTSSSDGQAHLRRNQNPDPANLHLGPPPAEGSPGMLQRWIMQASIPSATQPTQL